MAVRCWVLELPRGRGSLLIEGCLCGGGSGSLLVKACACGDCGSHLRATFVSLSLIFLGMLEYLRGSL